MLALYLIIFIPLMVASPQQIGAPLSGGDIVQSIIVLIFVFGVWMALYIIPLVGVIKRRPYSVPFTRVMLIITMFGFPVGTIIGLVLWRRINHPLAKKYLNYRT